MKTKTLAVIAFLIATLNSAYAEQQPKMNGKLRVTTLTPVEICYTGKPYNENLKAYLFKNRNYSPTANRWTTPDPSGFFDGSNDRIYTPVPTVEFDWQGLYRMKQADGIPIGGTSGSRLSMTVDDVPQDNYTPPGVVVPLFYFSAGMHLNWTVASGSAGWIVQHIQVSYDIHWNNGMGADSGKEYKDSVYDKFPNDYPKEYWEAWQVDAQGNVYAVDAAGAPIASVGDRYLFMASKATHGEYHVSGHVTFLSNAAVSANDPSTWGLLTGAGGLHATTTQPVWWTDNNTYIHSMDLLWE